MHDLIQTQNLGPVAVSDQVVTYFIKDSGYSDVCAATEATNDILQSSRIEQLEVPVQVSGSMLLEFWVHQASSMVFTVLPKDGYRLVSMAVKRDMSDFVFDTE